MNKSKHTQPGHSEPAAIDLSNPVVREALVGSMVALIGICALATMLTSTVTLPQWALPPAIGAFALIVAFLLAQLPTWHPHHRFGAANMVTTTRLALTLLLLGFAGADSDPATAWSLVAIATLALSLDAVDGSLARWQGTVSRFGARFDMEVDAFLILVLSIVVWQFGKVPVWVLASGVMRYAFVAAGLLLPWLQNDLPASTRRQAVCVLQVSTLIVCLAPLIPASRAGTLAAFSLAALIASFAVDVYWLARRQKPTPSGDAP